MQPISSVHIGRENLWQPSRQPDKGLQPLVLSGGIAQTKLAETPDKGLQPLVLSGVKPIGRVRWDKMETA